jgi:hypothetical protein
MSLLGTPLAHLHMHARAGGRSGHRPAHLTAATFTCMQERLAPNKPPSVLLVWYVSSQQPLSPLLLLDACQQQAELHSVTDSHESESLPCINHASTSLPAKS